PPNRQAPQRLRPTPFFEILSSLGMGVAAEVLSNPVVGKVDPNTGFLPTNSETKNNSNGTSVSPLLNVEFGLKNGIGLFYSAGFIRKTTGADPVDANGPLITEANRKKFGVTLNFESENGNLFQIGGESEIMDAEVVTSLAVGSGSSRSIIKTSTLAKLTGRGLYFGWVGRSDTTLTSLKLGIMDYTFDHKSFKGTQSIFLSLGVSFDLWRGWSR
ncbi:MAG: hypothetical protein IPK04_15760, partial [Bdellovibrionales bacterium]|nr:hypothetical protein [Bdellovibrionales bacterium]